MPDEASPFATLKEHVTRAASQTPIDDSRLTSTFELKSGQLKKCDCEDDTKIRMNAPAMSGTIDFVSLFSSIVATLLEYGPRIVSAVMILIAGFVAGKCLAWFVHGMVSRWGFGPVFKKTSVGRVILLSGYTPAQFFASSTKWAVYLISAYMATEILAIPVLLAFMKDLVLYLPSFVSGVILLIVGFTFSDLVGDIVKQAGGSDARAEYRNPFGDTIRTILYFIVLVMALAQMKIDVTILYIFAQAFSWTMAIVTAIAFGWNLKDRIKPYIDQILPQTERVKDK
ncbi:MAG: hypothetical protein V1857_03725 [archaeon]